MSKQLTNDSLVDRVLELESKITKCYNSYQSIPDSLALEYYEMLDALTEEELEQLNQKLTVR